MASAWIDFKELRARLDFGEVLAHYGVEINASGDQHHSACPLPSHHGSKRSSGFSAQLATGIFNCFDCGAKGNVLDFAVLMDGGNPRNGEDLRRTAQRLQERFIWRTSSQQAKQAAINAPLDFELKQLDTSHPYFPENEIAREAVEHFGLGYCSRGMLGNHIAVPLHNAASQLIGYAGVSLEVNCGYRFPATRERHGTIHRFDASLVLYNAHRITEPCDDLIVVEDMELVWWLYGNGIGEAVATFADRCSHEQARQIIELVLPTGMVWIFSDSTAFAQQVMTKVALRRPVRWINSGK